VSATPDIINAHEALKSLVPDEPPGEIGYYLLGELS
jgi:hypothetical protein